MSKPEKIAVHCPTEDEFKEGDDVEVLRGGYKGLVGEIVSTTKFSVKVKTKSKETEGHYWYFSTYKDRLKLIEGRAFEVGDRVEVTEGNIRTEKGYIGIIQEINKEDCRLDNGYYTDIKDLKLTPEHTVPLRVDDRVRVVSGYKKGNIYKVENADEQDSLRLLDLDGSFGAYLEARELTLIPTEKDITVGSVWAELNNPKCTRTVVEVGCVIQTQLDMANTKCEMSWNKSKFLKELKLMHRGDEVVEEEYTSINFTPLHTDRLNVTITTEKQTNKKEKKMEVTREDVIVGSQWTAPTHYGGDVVTVTKIDGLNDPHFNIGATDKSSWIMSDFLKHMRPLKTKPNKKGEKKMKKAEKVVALGNLVEDTDCNNQGKVVALYPKKELVSYEEEDGNVVTTHVSNLISRFKMPKPKQVKGKGKGKNKKGKK